MNLKEAVDKFVDACVHIYTETGAYVDEEYNLEFDKTEHDRLFSGIYYIPDYRDWLMENAKLVKKTRVKFYCPEEGV